ncbi:hypothetical protein [uncultured Friedmanniella sp.]|uniref:hypothetical protein n=1 Tax=uncultured Friedmanniella sp. TaxID=335381 RepID=UPI0035CAFAE1
MLNAPVRGATRLVRVGALGGGSLLLATSAHVLGGGRLPAGWLLAVTGLLLGVVAVTLTARRCRFPVLLVALTAEQLLLHLFFEAASQVVPGCSTLVMTADHATHAALPTCAMATAMHPAVPGWAMWVAHLLATALTAALLARGEAWCWRAAERVVALATAAPSSRVRVRTARPTVVRPFTRPTLRLGVTASPRGPPLGRACC